MAEECFHFKFILFVTGEGEEEHLPKLFSSLSQSGICSFKVGRRIGQRRPRMADGRLAHMTRTGQRIPDIDFEQISAPARRYLGDNRCNCIILIDDLEWLDQWEPKQIFERYRAALDAGLPDALRYRASVHFLVNMLEAYFFAHPDALNNALNLMPPITQYDGDVELIRNPKSEIKQLFPDYNERKCAGKILDKLDLDIVLSNAEYCASLRTCVKWIIDQLRVHPIQETFDSYNFEKRFHLQTGRLNAVTSNQ